jgi:hypothetical protein
MVRLWWGFFSVAGWIDFGAFAPARVPPGPASEIEN